jgi:F0F1-type ATP synthase epsilon subunit
MPEDTTLHQLPVPTADPPTATPTDEHMHVKVYSPYKTYFDQEALSISGVNSKGPFDILPRHHNFMTLIDPCELVIRTHGATQRIRIARGIMHVKANHVVIFLDV